MKKQRTTALFVGTLFVFSLSLTSYASESVKTETIGNITYDVPSDWKSAVAEDDSESTITYAASPTIMVTSYMDIDMDMSGLDATLQKMLIDSVASSYESLTNYSESYNNYGTFENYTANVRMFTYDNSGANYTILSNTMVTGEGVAMFMYGAPTSNFSSANFSEFENIARSMKTVSSSSIAPFSDPSVKYFSGMYKVGVDIPSGEYVVFADNGYGYFCVSSDSIQDKITFNDDFV